MKMGARILWSKSEFLGAELGIFKHYDVLQSLKEKRRNGMK
jgi:hypothetical protein